ncbi:hypothetical protein KAJ83_18870 [Marivibrio halodurans]|uniref:Uncharacterized protein n=1 Tax=Marivibrio halodurans TaxID=2039722 RepID=A0A8J7V483_9PROT|nr:hypothetical protein [Marivibrio halodurans]MBP5859091.1 hypothetical protein [Marivibrio halodurans]
MTVRRATPVDAISPAGRRRAGVLLPTLLLAFVLPALAACSQGAGGRALDVPPSADGPGSDGDIGSSALLADPGRDRSAVASLPADLPPVDDDPDQFIGLDALAVARRLGAPDIVRRDGPAEVWLYGGSGCVVDIFLYKEKGKDPAQDTGGAGVPAGSGGLVTRYVDLRSPAKTAEERRACLAQMLRAARAQARGA